LAACGTRREAEERKLRQALLRVIGRSEAPLLEAEILHEVEGRKATKEATLRRLVSGGHVLRLGAGKKNDPFPYVPRVQSPGTGSPAPSLREGESGEEGNASASFSLRA